jgi:hypothetical protein
MAESQELVKDIQRRVDQLTFRIEEAQREDEQRKKDGLPPKDRWELQRQWEELVELKNRVERSLVSR